MINTLRPHTTNNGPVLLTFSNWTVNRFCKLVDCKSNRTDILLHILFGQDTLNTTIALLQAASEATAKQKKIPMVYDEFDVSEWANDPKCSNDASKVVNAFLGCVLNIEPDDVPAKIEEISRQALEEIQGGGDVTPADPNA